MTYIHTYIDIYCGKEFNYFKFNKKILATQVTYPLPLKLANISAISFFGG